MTGLFLPQRILDAMIIQAETEDPIEACGLLSGQEKIVREIHELTNADNSEEHFSMLPTEQFAVAKQVRAAGMEILAVYHTHPASPARPSEEDVRLAFTPNMVYLILSLLVPWRPELRGFRIHDGDVVEIPIEVFDDQDYDPAQDYAI
jgi:proteasome lid subunit RPN8/RPN11